MVVPSTTPGATGALMLMLQLTSVAWTLPAAPSRPAIIITAETSALRMINLLEGAPYRPVVGSI